MPEKGQKGFGCDQLQESKLQPSSHQNSSAENSFQKSFDHQERKIAEVQNPTNNMEFLKNLLIGHLNSVLFKAPIDIDKAGDAMGKQV